MERFNKDIIFNYQPTSKTFELGLKVTEELGKVDSLLASTFKNALQASKIFAFIESRYSSKIEGIYTTLFENVNTNQNKAQKNQISPIVSELFKTGAPLTSQVVNFVAETININQNVAARFNEDFGVYQKNNRQNLKIYEPPLSQKIVETLLDEVMTKAQSDSNIIQMLHTHIMFEKVHPYVDANGRIGRLIWQRSMAKLMRFSHVLPLSQALNANLTHYYSAFVISSNEGLDLGIQKLLTVLLKMCKTTTNFLIDLTKFVDQNMTLVKKTSFRVNDDLAESILISLQSHALDINQDYGLNVKTIDAIFNKLNLIDLAFNRKIVDRKVVYWNIELETLIDKWFKG